VLRALKPVLLVATTLLILTVEQDINFALKNALIYTYLNAAFEK
jgi:hypothetical protein